MLKEFIEYFLYTAIATAVITIFYVLIMKLSVNAIPFRVFMIYLVISFVYYLLRKRYKYDHILKLSGFLIILLALGLIVYHTLNLILTTKFRSGKGITLVFTLLLVIFFIILMRNVLIDELKTIFTKA